MTILTLPHQNHNANPFRILLPIALMVLTIAIGLTISHAVPKHGNDAAAVRECLDHDGPLQIWQHDNRIMLICQLSPTRFGIQVLQEKAQNKFDEITAFIKNKMTQLDQVERYLQNGGAVKVWDVSNEQPLSTVLK